MKLSIISFTENGKQLSESIAKMMEKDMPPKWGNDRKIEACLYTKCKSCMEEAHSSDISIKTPEKEQGTFTRQNKALPVLPVKIPLEEWAREQMKGKNALLFIGACGIAVRAIAPSLTDKLHDAPVLVMDEKGRYIIPILSGHMGGANELADDIARKTGAEPVITTATDINQKFAVDLFAKRNSLSIVNKDGIVKVSSKILSGKSVTMSIEPGHKTTLEEASSTGTDCGIGNCLPDGVHLIPYPPMEAVDIVVTSESRTFDTAILLKPKEYTIGIGCKRGKSADEIEHFIQKKINELGITAEQIFALASISQKSDEQGIIAWCQKESIPFFTYTAEELQNVKGNFTKSAFVKEQVGVDNVCERASLKACEEAGNAFSSSPDNNKTCQERGHIIASKYAENGMTIAVAKRKWKIYFYGG